MIIGDVEDGPVPQVFSPLSCLIYLSTFVETL